MTHLVRSILLCLVVTIVGVGNVNAQVPPGHYSPRWHCPQTVCTVSTPPPAPVVVITSPTTQPVFTTASPTLALAGTVEHDQSVTTTWSNSRGGSGPVTGSASWSVAGAASPTIVFSDDFTSASNVDVTTRPPNTGEGWHEVYNTAGHAVTYCRNRATGGYLYPIADANSNTLICLANPTQALSGANYDLSVKVNGLPGLDDPEGFLFGADTTTNPATWDSHNYCGVQWYNFSANPDVIFWKKVNDVVTTLATSNSASNPATGDIMTVEVRSGGAITVKNTGATIIGPITDSFCANRLGVGVIFGASAIATDDVTTLQLLDDFKVTDQGASTGGITLQTGINVITVTSCDASSTCGTDTLTVTYGVTDSTNPNALITAPTSSQIYSTSSAGLSLGGSGTDNTGVSSMTWTCNNCSVTSGTAACATCSSTATSVTWTASLTLGCSGGGTANSIVATAHDAAGNTSPSSTLVATCTSSDSTKPIVTIQGPASGGSYLATSSNVTINGTSSDNVGVTTVTATCDICTSVGTMSGTLTWSVPVVVSNGVNTVTVTASDQAGNTQFATIAITYHQPLTITTVGIRDATQSAVYSPFTLTAIGGTAPYTWVNDASGTSSLASGGAPCTGLTVSSAGVISGTPTTLGNCTIVYRVTDAVPTSVTKSLTLTVNAVSTDGNAFFTSMLARSDFWKGLSLRPQTGVTSFTSPYYVHQLERPAQGGFYDAGSGTDLSKDQLWITYDEACWNGGSCTDTHPHKQNAAKLLLTAFQNASDAVVAVNMGHDPNTDVTIQITSASPAYLEDRSIKVDSEIMLLTTKPSTVVGTQTWGVVRAQHGTAIADHTAGTMALVSGNSLPQQQFRIPICATTPTAPIGCDQAAAAGTYTEDGHTYLFMWEVYYPEEWVDTGLAGHKSFTFAAQNRDTKLWENRGRYDGGSACTNCRPVSPAFVLGSDVASTDTRSYERPCIGNECTAWSSSLTTIGGPNTVCVNTGTNCLDPMYPMSGAAIIKPNRWIRWYFMVKQVANDWDPITVWVSTQDADPIKMYDQVQESVPINTKGTPPVASSMGFLNIEFNTSSTQCQNRCNRDLPLYIRNYVVLKDPPTDLVGAGILVRPSGN